MTMLKEAPSDPRYDQNDETAAGDQAFPTNAERRSQNDDEGGEGVHSISRGGRMPDHSRLAKMRQCEQNPPRARKKDVQSKDQTGLEDCECTHSAGDAATRTGARRPRVRTSHTSTT